MKFVICDDYEQMSDFAAGIFMQQIRKKPDIRLGLATGSSPIGLYSRLIAAYRRGEVDFSRVVTFNLDEYYPIAAENMQSYIYFMKKQLFDHVNIRPENINIPDGSASDYEAECRRYDAKIEACGGIDLQLLGCGRNGHIGFNEPGDFLHSSTHRTALHEDTIKANSRFFASSSDVPTHALTMGMGAILKAKKIVLIMNGPAKRAAFESLLDDRVSPQCPVTFLKLHRDVTVIADLAAAGR